MYHLATIYVWQTTNNKQNGHIPWERNTLVAARARMLDIDDKWSMYKEPDICSAVASDFNPAYTFDINILKSILNLLCRTDNITSMSDCDRNVDYTTFNCHEQQHFWKNGCTSMSKLQVCSHTLCHHFQPRHGLGPCQGARQRSNRMYWWIKAATNIRKIQEKLIN